MLSLCDPQDPFDLTLELRGAFVEAQLRGALALPSHAFDGVDHSGSVALQYIRRPLRELVEIVLSDTADPSEVPLDAVQLSGRPAEVHRKEPRERGRGRVRRRPSKVRAKNSIDSWGDLDNRRNARWGRAQPNANDRLETCRPIERRIEALEKRSFEQRGLVLGYARTGEDTPDPADHPAESGPVEAGAPIAPDTRSQIRRAADVEQMPARVDEEIDPRRGWELREIRGCNSEHVMETNGR